MRHSTVNHPGVPLTQLRSRHTNSGRSFPNSELFSFVLECGLQNCVRSISVKYCVLRSRLYFVQVCLQQR